MAELRKVIITGADSKYFPLMSELIQSAKRFKGSEQFDFRYFDMGLKDEEKQWLADHGCAGCVPQWNLDIPEKDRTPHNHGRVLRPFLREHFPGYDIYIWIDADVWLQDWQVIERYVEGALKTQLAVSTERDRGYQFKAWLFGWFAKHYILGYGFFKGLWLLSRPQINDGFFAMTADAPHWAIWVECFKRAVEREGRVEPHDQFAMVDAVFSHRLPFTLMPATCNWICDRGTPLWNEETKVFCVPYAPHTPISTMHLAGPAKSTRFKVKTVAGGERDMMLRYSSLPAAGE